MPRNTKLALDVCHSYDVASHMLHFSDFTTFINYIINPHIINQLNAIIESRINDAIDALSEYLYLFIAAVT